MLRKILLAVLITCLAGWTFAQQGALKGKIKISADFDELPKDIAEVFGILEP